MKVHYQIGFVGMGVLLALNTTYAGLVAQYLFNEGSGTTVANSGSAGSSGNLSLGGSPAAVFSAAGFTPNGSGHSMDNTASPAAGTGGYAQTSASFDAVDNLSQATITGWMNIQVAASLARLVDRADGSVGSGQWSLYIDGDTSKLQLNLGGTSYVSNSFLTTDQWIFFAVVINEDDGGNKIKFYSGDTLTAVTSRGVLSSTSPGLGDNSKKLTIGNRENAGRAFDGYLWDVRIYDEALSSSALETVRVSGIPEPTTLGLIFLPAGILLSRRRFTKQ